MNPSPPSSCPTCEGSGTIFLDPATLSGVADCPDCSPPVQSATDDVDPAVAAYGSLATNAGRADGSETEQLARLCDECLTPLKPASQLCHDPMHLQARSSSLQEEVETLKGARDEALFALIGGDGPPDSTTAQLWLRTTLRRDHPNYVDPASLAPQKPGDES